MLPCSQPTRLCCFMSLACFSSGRQLMDLSDHDTALSKYLFIALMSSACMTAHSRARVILHHCASQYRPFRVGLGREVLLCTVTITLLLEPCHTSTVLCPWIASQAGVASSTAHSVLLYHKPQRAAHLQQIVGSLLMVPRPASRQLLTFALAHTAV